MELQKYDGSPRCIISVFLAGLLLFGAVILNAQNNTSPLITQITSEQGLSNNGVTCILQDHYGFLWFGTWDGLNKYDGKKIVIYKTTEHPENSISHDNISCLYEDHSGYLWIGTKSNGISRMKLSTGRIDNLSITETGIEAAWITDIQEDSEGNIWVAAEDGIYRMKTSSNPSSAVEFELIGSSYFVSDIQPDKQGNLLFTSYEGLFCYVQSEEKLIRYDDLPFSMTNLTSIAIDSRGNYWISSWTDGLIRGELSKDSGRIVFEKINLDQYIEPSNFGGIYKVLSDSRNKICVALWGQGLLYMNEDMSEVEVIRRNYNSLFSLNNNYVLSLYEDHAGLIWVGTDDGGVNKINIKANPFYTYSREFGQDFGRIGPVLQTSDHILFVGTRSGGLFYASFDSLRFQKNPALDFRRVELESSNNNSPSSNEISALFEDVYKNIWIGTPFGLYMIPSGSSIRSGEIRKFTFDAGNPSSISTNNITCINEDARANLWIGTMDRGLNRLDSMDEHQSPCFTRFMPSGTDSTGLGRYRIRSLSTDSQGSFWIGTDCGLCRISDIHPQHEYEFISFLGKNIKLQQSSIICLSEDEKGYLWAGTTNGIFVFSGNPEKTGKNTISTFTISDGLPSNMIQDILFDKRNTAWITTNNGMAKIPADNGSVTVFNRSDGVSGGIFSERSGFINNNDFLFLGDNNGLNIFNPDEIKKDNYVPNVVILAIHTQSQDSKTRINPVEDDSLFNGCRIKLNNNQRNFSVEFASLCFLAPEKNLYQYKLEGFDEEWIHSGNRNVATYTNIPPGKYTFSLKGSNGNGIWNPEASFVQIRILPPFWATPLAILIYLLVAFILIYSLTRINMNRVRLKNELVLEKVEKEKEEELNRTIHKFFTNISHEFRTPLTLILISIKKLKQNPTLTALPKKSLDLIERSASLLLRLVNEIMDVRKIENKQMKIKPGKYDLVSFVKQIFESLVPLAGEKRIEYHFSVGEDIPDIYFDGSMIEKVFWNVLSNAFKYTPEEGRVDINVETVTLEKEKQQIQYARVSIRDNGPGIPPEELEKIFDRFYQAEFKNDKKKRGTGLGLSIAKEMLELNQGCIEVESDQDKGTSFHILLPLDNPELEKLSQETEAQKRDVLDQGLFFAESHQTDVQNTSDASAKGSDKPLLLIIEDNHDLLIILRDTLSGSFKIEMAVNGREGLDVALKIMPDIIVSDIALPEMNGIALCEKLKSDIKTSHIPIILLTAITSVEKHLQGLQVNADDYFTKPFNIQILEARLENLIRERKYLREKYQNTPVIDTKKLELSSIDQHFIDKAVGIVEENLSDDNFSIEDFAKNIGMSRSSLYRKIQALTGQSAKEFIRDIRIKKAARLLEEGDRTVSEVAFEVGFISRSYFAKCFNERFHETPSKFLESKKNDYLQKSRLEHCANKN